MPSTVVTWHPLADGTAPEWASGWGEDRHGPFVELTIAEVTQWLRWVPAGRFQMGSVDDDEVSFEDERPRHWVEITRGFWLFDTPVTQELWEAVMGENPSDFKESEKCRQRPVENVSWDDCQQFFARCSELSPGITLGLPTEAEWEYACRAGTTEATYSGAMEILGDCNAPILDSIAWYGGNSGVDWELEGGVDMTGWPAKQYEFAKGGTRVVATREANAWGLYDMLGNVWEWCRDASRREYGSESVTDPFHDGDASAYRVVRGGSWLYDARGVRAAYRNAYSPGLRNYNVGFRPRVL